MTVALGTVGLAGFLWLTVFQLVLAAGLPLGHMAWGGAQRVLSSTRRVASLLSAGLAALGAVTVAQAAGFGPVWLPQILLRPLLGTFAVLFALSLIGNAMSSSRVERWHGVPLTLILSLSTGGLAVML